MKKILLLLIFIISVSVIFAANDNRKAQIQQKSRIQTNEVVYSNAVVSPFENYAQGDKWGVFWINLLIAAIGVFSIYGFAAGIVAVAITYFATKGNKKAFKKAIWGCIVGCIIGGLLLALKLSLI